MLNLSSLVTIPSVNSYKSHQNTNKVVNTQDTPIVKTFKIHFIRWSI